MTVSFDLDDTLFVSPNEFKTEQELKFPFNKIYKERLRLGTIELIKTLQEREISVWVYTTSFRSEKYIKGLFRCYGIRFDRIINGDVHSREVQGNNREPMPSKYPGKYRIDLHIDDDISVYQNGRRYGYRVMIVNAEDDEWVKRILCEAGRLSQQHTANDKSIMLDNKE